MRILIPLAARSPFFPPEEFHFPLPLIEINSIPIIKLVIDNLSVIDENVEFIFIASSEECREFSLDNVFRLVTNNRCEIIELKNPTQGSLCSCLMAIDLYNDEQPLIICNPDQIFDLNLSLVIKYFQARHFDAGVISFETLHPRWSYIRVDEEDNIVETAVQKVISRLALAGFIYFARGQDFATAAMDSIAHGCDINGSYHIAPSLNELILKNMKLGHYQVPSNLFHSFYLPQKIAEYERLLQNKSLNFMPKINTLTSTKISKTLPKYPPVTVVIPMAGLGSRFVKEGYQKPKPFIDVLGKTMIERVMDNLSLPEANYILLARREHIEREANLVAQLLERPKLKIITVEQLTEGTACTVLLARQEIDRDAPLLIANCDQIVDFNCVDFIDDCFENNLDGSILVFEDPELNPKWSFAKIDGDGLVTEVKEKVPISDLATVGIYLFSKGSDFIEAALDMIVNNDRVNGEFYTCPVYNYTIRNNKKIGVYKIPFETMHGLGTPEDLQEYLQWKNK
jgi:NDP-sugar pyrophosphorylase family protein